MCFSCCYIQLGFEDTFPQEEKTQTLPPFTEALERVYRYTKLGVYHACVIVVGFPCTTFWAVVVGLFAFSLTWFWLPGLNIAAVASRMLLPLLRLPMVLFSEILAPCLEVFVGACSQLCKRK